MLGGQHRRGSQQHRLPAIRDHGERILGAGGKKDYDEKVATLKQLKQENVPVEQSSSTVTASPRANSASTR